MPCLNPPSHTPPQCFLAGRPTIDADELVRQLQQGQLPSDSLPKGDREAWRAASRITGAPLLPLLLLLLLLTTQQHQGWRCSVPCVSAAAAGLRTLATSSQQQ